ncbi:hypothetical protein HPB48_008040 [Haemaphysalis longicornis]|uniref:Peptidase M13 C-terminal domain-containing protein n=1 Tax=Haemaphysalis longicornis TaxID=44386 RepID=A0A9J6FQ27_HAELO|nr:hypothetical protein HPB48_008040 [Haemaphysalis longicornis]
MYLAARFKAERRAIIDEQVGNVRRVAVAKTPSLSWADDLFKRKAVDKLRNITTVLWPPHGLTAQPGDSVLYGGDFLKEGRSFVESWIAALEHWRRVSTDPEFSDSSKGPWNLIAPLIRYVPALNTIWMSAACLSRPAFYAAGTTATVYGSLGSSYAHELVKAFDTTGLAFDAVGRITDYPAFD